MSHYKVKVKRKHHVKYRIITDKENKLEWIVGPDKGTTHVEAEEFIYSLSSLGGEWRLPTLNELKGLYHPDVNNVRRTLDPVFENNVQGW